MDVLKRVPIREQEAEAERLRVQAELEQKAKDNEMVYPYLDEVRNFQVMLATRRQLRVDQKEEELQFQRLLLQEKELRQQQAQKKKRGFFG